MTEPIFFKPSTGLTVSEIAALTKASAHADARLDRRITNIAPVELAGPGDLTFIDSAKFADDLKETDAGACLLTEQFEDIAPKHVALLRVREPYRAFVMVARALFPDGTRPSSLFEASGISADAKVHPASRLESEVTIDPGAVIGPRAEIGAGSVISAGAVIGPGVRIGRDCVVGANASIVHAIIGDRVVFHAGCRIGQDGYGYLPGPKGHEKIPQLGRVIIQDDVEIGANTAIDRGGIRDTMIGEGTKIDNLVQIGHNVVIGRHCILVGQVGISGSVRIEDYAMLGGQAGIADHVTVGEGAKVAAKAGVMSDIPPRGRWGGIPAMSMREWFRMTATLRRLTYGNAPGSRKKDEGDGG